MSYARVVKLVPVDNTSVTFEEAFGEYSEARGKGRARRKKRKLERIENRREVKQARIAARDEVKSEREDRRLGRRAKRKAARQDIRSEQAQARQTRRTGRTEARLGRKTMRQESRVKEPLLDQGLDVERPETTMDTGFDQQYEQPETAQTYNDETQGAYQPETTSGGYVDQGGYEDQGGYGGQGSQGGYGGQGGYDYGDEEGAPYTEEDYMQPQGGGEGNYYGDEDAESGEGVYDEEGDYVGEESGYLADYDASGDNFDGIDPDVQNVVDKLAWNAECVKRLEQKRKMQPNQAQNISKKIIEHKRRFNELKSSVDDYTNCCGDYSSADGLEPQRRKMMVRKAWGLSKMKVKNPGKRIGQYNRPADDVIPVAADLNPSFSRNRIVVPNKMSSATGLNGIDLQNDFDAPEVREIFLGADGSKKGSISWGGIAVGIAVGVAAVWAIKKYKLLK